MSLPLPSTSDHHSVGSKDFRLALNLLAWLGCAVGFWLLGLVAGPAAGALMFLPVIVTAWTWGLRAGVWAGFLGFIVTAYPLYLISPNISKGFFIVVLMDGGPPAIVAMIIGGSVGYLRDLRLKLHVQHQQLIHLSQHDALTKLLNRAALETRLTHYLDQKVPTAVLFIDLDGFKRINDNFGHAVGDELLQAVAQRLRSNVREADLVARLGGDEFVLAFPNLSDQQVTQVTQNLLGALTTPFSIKGQTLQIGASVGVSCYPADGLDTQALIKRADNAMYRVKERGKNSYTFWAA